jgi:hypothetical protein
LQNESVPHGLAHPPQLLLSVFVLTQALPQRTSPAVLQLTPHSPAPLHVGEAFGTLVVQPPQIPPPVPHDSAV